MDEQDRIPVIWTKHGDRIVAVTATERRIDGWTAVVSPHLDRALAHLAGTQGSDTGTVQTRTFTMRDIDLPFWDTATRKGSDGYSYGLVWGDDKRFLKNLQFKEVTPDAAAGIGIGHPPPIDPAMMAMVAAMHQVQETLERIEEKVDRILVVVEWLEERRQSRQAAELLSAVAALKSVARRCFVNGVVEPEDLFRIGHLEQVVGTVHREICMELADFAKVFSYTDFDGAKRARNVDRGRLADLVALDVLALDGLKAWHQLMLLSKAASRRLADGEIDASRDELSQLLAATQGAVTKLAAVKSRMANRSVWTYLRTTGIPAGRLADRSMRREADAARQEAQETVDEAAKELEALGASLDEFHILLLGSQAPLQLLPADPAA